LNKFITASTYCTPYIKSEKGSNTKASGRGVCVTVKLLEDDPVLSHAEPPIWKKMTVNMNACRHGIFINNLIIIACVILC